MPLHMIGGSGHEASFNRTFFNVTLGDLIETGRKEGEKKLTLFLADGTTFDVCNIEALADTYLIVQTYRRNDDACDLSVNLIPYGLIYRIEIAPRDEQDGTRVGFHWKPQPKSRSSARKK